MIYNGGIPIYSNYKYKILLQNPGVLSESNVFGTPFLESITCAFQSVLARLADYHGRNRDLEETVEHAFFL